LRVSAKKKLCWRLSFCGLCESTSLRVIPFRETSRDLDASQGRDGLPDASIANFMPTMFFDSLEGFPTPVTIALVVSQPPKDEVTLHGF